MWSTKHMYIIILVIILLILIYVNQDIFHTLYEGATDETTSSASIDANVDMNKQQTGVVYSSIGDNQLDAIDSQIQSCLTLIEKINEKIPYKIENIVVDSVSQSEIDTDVGINITSEDSRDSIKNPITDTQMKTALWKLNIVLPKGKKGPVGDQGPKGDKGDKGGQGPIGDQGVQGPWGNSKECDTC
jgi:hypothetical protein